VLRSRYSHILNLHRLCSLSVCDVHILWLICMGILEYRTMDNVKKVSTSNSERYTLFLEYFRICKAICYSSFPMSCLTLITSNIYLIVKDVIVLD
jgi:hypothetical protein